MKNTIRQSLVKVISMVLIIFLTVPSQIFASSLFRKNDKTYDGTQSIMGIASSNGINDLLVSQGEESDQDIYQSDKSITENEYYIIEKSVNYSKARGLITYRIAISLKTTDNPDQINKAVFAINSNTEQSELKVDGVAVVENGLEVETNFKDERPSFLSADSNIDSLSIETDQTNQGLVYYISTKLEDSDLSTEHTFGLDIALLNQENKTLVQDRYSVKKDAEDNLVEDENTSLISGNYTAKTSNLLGENPSSITWTDYIFSKTDKEFIYQINLDESQDTTNAKIYLDFYQARENGFVLDKAFSQDIPFAKELKLQIPQGYIARLEVKTNVKENANPQKFTYNNKEIENPIYKEEDQDAKNEDPLPEKSPNKDAGLNSSNDIIADEKDLDFSANSKTKKEEQTTYKSLNTDAWLNSFNDIITDEKDLDFSANSKTKKEEQTTDKSLNIDSGSNSSNDIIANEKDLDFSTNSKTENAEIPTSAITLNRDAYISKLEDEKRLTSELKKVTNQLTYLLESYSKDEISLEDLKSKLKYITQEENIDAKQSREIITALIAGLNEDKFKAASLEPSKLVYDSIEKDQVKTAVARPETKLPEKTPDKLAAEKLAEDGITIEDFQNYMYELEEKYNLTNEDADRIYTENADAIQELVTKAQEEKTTGDVFAVNRGFANKTFRLTTNMNVLSMPLWSIPSGWYFDINVGPYLYLDSDPNDLVVNGKTVATAQYFPATNTVRYTFNQPVYKTTSIPINQDFKFNTEAIGDSNPIDVNISVKPKNNPGQTQSYTVYADSSRNPSESNNIYESKVVLDKGEFTQTYGTHISRDEGNNIRYSYVPNKPIMNSYELAYRDVNNNDPDLSYYVLLEAKPGDGSFINNSTIDIGLMDGKKIRDLDIYSIPLDSLDNLRKSFVDGNVKVYLGSNYGPEDYKYGMDTSNVRVTLSSSGLNNSAYLIKVRAKDATDGQTFNFNYRWTSGDFSIDNYNNPYTISLNSPTIRKDNSINSSSYIKAQIYPLGFDSNKYSAFEIRDISHGFSPLGFCIDARTHPPDSDAVYAGERLVINDLNDFEEFVKSSPNNIGRNTTVLTGNLRKVYEDLSIIYYLAESGQLFSNVSKKPTSNIESMAMQSLIYRALDGRIGKLSAPNYLSNDKTEKNYNESWWLLGNMWEARNIPSRDQVTSKANQFDQKVLNERNKGQANIKLITDSTTLYFYNNLKSSKATGTKYQSIMTGKITSKPVPDITFTKVNKDTGSKVSNAKFVLYKGNSTTPYDDGKGIVKLSNSNGEFGWANLEDGLYTVIEVEAPQGYEPVNNQKVANFTVSNGTITNKSIAHAYSRNGNIANKSYTPTTSEFSFMKVNSMTNSPLAGAQFILENNSGNVSSISSNITEADGIVRFKDIPDGTYVLKETKRPNEADGKTYNEVPLNKALATISFADGTYQISNASKSFKQLNNHITVTNVPDRYRGSFTINKTKLDEDGTKPFQDVTFTLTQTGGPRQQSQIQKSTDINGKVTFTGLEQNTIWKLTETTPEGFVDYKYEWKVEVGDEDKETAGVTITPISDSAKNTNLSTVSGTTQSPTLNVVNKKKVVVRVKKVDSETNEPLEGVVLGLYNNKSDDTPIGQATTNASGIATFSDIPIGENLYVKEIKGLDNYKSELVNMDTNQVEDITINATFKNTPTVPTITVGNEPASKGKLVINKVDDKENSITSDSAKFSLQQNDGNKHYLDDKGRFVESEFTFSTDETGKLNITNIPEGKYTLRETKAPSGYKINENKRTWTVNIDIDGKATIDGQSITELNVVNQPILTRVDLMKYGPNKNGEKELLDGGRFILNYRQNEDDDWQKVGETPAEDGLVSFDNLREGYYEVREEEAPTGYYEYDSGNRRVFKKATYKRRTGALKEFQVINGKVYINDEPINDNNNAMINHSFGKGKITVKKFTDDSKGLSGVKFELYKDGDADPITGETDENGILVFEDLPYGKYWVREISGPPGYIVDKSFKAAVLGYMYDAPTTNGTDASNKLQLTSADIRSSGNTAQVVRPNYGEAIWYNARFAAKQGQRLNPGDQFTLKLSDNVTIDGLGKVNDGDLDLSSDAGRLAIAKIAEDRKSITYTITDVADKYYGLDWINISIPLYIDRTAVKNDQQINVNVGIENNQQTYWQNDIQVVYSDYLSYADAILSYTPVLNESGFENLTYINYTGKYMKPKTFKFRKHSQDRDVKFTFYRLKDRNTANNSINLPGSFKPDLDNTNLFENLGTVTPTLENGYYVSGKLNNTDFSNDSYVVKVTGNFINGENLRTFDTRSELDYVNEYGYGYKCGAQTSLAVYHPCAYGEVREEVKEQTIEVFNRKNSVEFLKIDGASDITNPTKLSGAEFELVKVEAGKEINYTDVKKADGNNDNGLRTSAENGKIRFELIPDGEYRLYETKAPAGYSIHSDRVLVSSFTVINGCIEVKDNKTTIPNFKYGKFKIKKTNPAGEALEGAEFTLTPLEVKFNIEEVTESTNQNGEVYFYNIPDGRYKLEETKAPSSYVTDPDTKLQILIVENGNVRFEKANDINQISDYTYDSEQSKSIHQPMASNNANDENIAKLEFVDNEIITVINRKPTYPSTGGDGTKIAFALIGTAIMITGLAYYGMYLSEKYRRRSSRSRA